MLNGFVELLIHRASKETPTRAVEYLLAWLMMVWGFALALPGDILSRSPQYVYLIAVAPESAWAAFSLTVGFLRLVALVINGGMPRGTPIMRFIGAGFGCSFWIVLGVLYWTAIRNGSPPFPAVGFFAVFFFFEGYSCYRCAQDFSRASVRTDDQSLRSDMRGNLRAVSGGRS